MFLVETFQMYKFPLLFKLSFIAAQISKTQMSSVYFDASKNLKYRSLLRFSVPWVSCLKYHLFSLRFL